MQISESRFSSDDYGVMELAESSVSISDIVHESNVPLYGKVGSRLSPSPISNREKSSKNIVTGHGDLTHQASGRTPQGVANNEVQVGVRTLSRCQNVQAYRSALRRNSNDFQTGSFSFFSSSLQSSRKICQKRKSDVQAPENLGWLQTSSSTDGQQLTVHGALPGRQESRSQDIDSAWKMMDKAKPMLHAYERSNSDIQVSEYPSNHGNGKILINNCPSSLYISKCQQFGKSTFKTLGKQFKHSSAGKRTEKQTH
ncbi:hypothetical protein K2173_027376 [Erythroxylum novogranatense]|uniref:Uncharacterized protein n=1 Tax=Erythroxylum novogranatense TaxID=1862640 RepID=A0AAV8U246_9ROSI|nr:hypothetical protein K2173_027376 [Erythroxylum novogranatense]